MNKKVWVYGAIGTVGSLGIAAFLTINNSFAQTDKSPHRLHHPDSNTPVQVQPAPPLPEANQMGQMMSGDIAQRFIVMMIPHHQDAVDMANLALTRAKHSEIKTLAVAIKRDQTREIQQMRGWYKAWYGIEVPAMAMMNSSGMMGNQGTEQGMMTQNGMMRTDLAALKNATDFDKEFLRQMIPHHQMAVHMAQMVLNQKTRPEIRALAQSIIKSQTAEIKQMQQWQKAWFK